MDVDAEVLSSHLDAEINLIDPETGVEFYYNDQFDGDDPRFNIGMMALAFRQFLTRESSYGSMRPGWQTRILMAVSSVFSAQTFF